MVSRHDDELHIRLGRIRDRGRGGGKPKTFVGEVMRAARKAGHTGKGFGRGSGPSARSRFGRGRVAAAGLAMRSPSRRVVVKARVVRHRGQRFRSAPLSKHLAYLKREGVTRDGTDASMFGPHSDAADERAFAERCEGDRHHFRFIVSPEDGAQIAELRAFTRELMSDVEHDLGTSVDWVAVGHSNTDNPHVHVLVRGVDANGADLVISRDYISRGLRTRAEERVTLELGPRSEQEIQNTLASEGEAERWTNLDYALRAVADDNAGVLDFRQGMPGKADSELRRLLIGRAMKLERLGLVDRLGPSSWSVKPGLEDTLRDLGQRGDIIKTMHRALAGGDREPSVADFAIHGDMPPPILGRLAGRGLHDELKGSAYVIIEGIDGRTHHLRFSDLEATGDASLGAVVEARTFEDQNRRLRLALLVRSDLGLDQQISASGATWLDHQLVAREPSPLAQSGFGAEVRHALERRTDHLIVENLAWRQGQRVSFARSLLDTLRGRELEDTAAKLASETGLVYRPSSEGEHVAGVYRRRVTLSSGRFAMIDNGLGFQLVPWRSPLEQQIGKQVSGVMGPGGNVEWSFGRKRGLAI